MGAVDVSTVVCMKFCYVRKNEVDVVGFCILCDIKFAQKCHYYITFRDWEVSEGLVVKAESDPALVLLYAEFADL